jgi:hypothetical protein
MDKPRGNSEDALPGESLITGVAHGLLIEFAFWILVGLGWLAFQGGVWGVIVLAFVGVFVGFAWRDFVRRTRNPIQAPKE